MSGRKHLSAAWRVLRRIHFSRPAVLLRQGLLIAAITFVLGEVVLRVYDRFIPLPILYGEFDNRWRPTPLSTEFGFRLNSRGFKTPEFETQKAPGTYRILGIGDSFAYGIVPYAYNYLTLTGERLNAAGRRVELINMGIPALDPADYLALLVKEGLALGPDMVSVSFFIGNDFVVQQQAPRWRDRSYVFTALKYLYALQTKVSRRVTPTSAGYEDAVGPMTDEAFLTIERVRMPVFVPNHPEFERGFAAAMAALLRMKEICDRRNIRFTVALLPAEVQVDAKVRRKVLDRLGLAPEAYDFTQPNRRLHEALTQHGIDFVDLLDAFVAAADKAPLYRPNDTHWNIAGNALAAELLTRHLLPLIPPSPGVPPEQAAKRP